MWLHFKKKLTFKINLHESGFSILAKNNTNLCFLCLLLTFGPQLVYSVLRSECVSLAACSVGYWSVCFMGSQAERRLMKALVGCSNKEQIIISSYCPPLNSLQQLPPLLTAENVNRYYLWHDEEWSAFALVSMTLTYLQEEHWVRNSKSSTTGDQIERETRNSQQ